MRLLDTETGQFIEKDPERTRYAILSHTWDAKGEQTYEELKKIQRRHKLGSHVPKASRLLIDLPLKMLRHSLWHDCRLSPKIRHACAIARKNGFRYIWIDSCCINKSSSSELSEAINSMYKWYRLAEVCYAYLADVPPGDDHHAKGSCFRESRWFTRGWTLQELVAPLRVEFLSEDWAPIESKQALVNLVESITNINAEALLKFAPLDSFSVAQRLSWAAKRETTREEDRAYSLLGIFNIHMPTLYGEGDHAFRRLQEQIMQSIPDQSLFAWGEIFLPGAQLPFSSFPTQSRIPVTAFRRSNTTSADSPNAFEDSRNIRRVLLPTSHHYELLYTFTPYGIRTEFQMIPLIRDLLSAIIPHSGVEIELELELNDSQWYLAILGCEHMAHPGHLIGRVCCIPSSESKSAVDFMYSGHIHVVDKRHDLFLLSPEIFQKFRPYTKLKTVCIPHPQSNRTDSDPFWSLQCQRYTVIKLVLLTETCGALRSRGYTANLRDPNPDHPTTHWLTLSHHEHTITITFEHTLTHNGCKFTINAKGKMSESRVQRVDSASDSSQADRRGIVSWHEAGLPWYTRLGHRTIKLSAAGAVTLTVDLSLDFAGTGVYSVRVDVQSDAPPASESDRDAGPVESAPPAISVGEDSEGREVALSRDDWPIGAIDTEDLESGREADIGGCEMAPRELREVRDLEAASDGAGDSDEGDERLT